MYSNLKSYFSKPVSVRHVTWMLSFVLGAGSLFFLPGIAEDSIRLNAISYIGTVITIIGLAITIAEIRFSIITTQTLQEATLTAISNIRSIEDASFLSECTNTIDAVITAIHSDKYEISLIEFRNFRKIFCKIRPNGQLPSNSEQTVDGIFLNKTEKTLIAATKTTVESPLSKPQRRKIVDDLLLIKSAIEFTNPAKRT